MGALHELANIAPTISRVVHELQKERGTSAVFIGSKGAKFSDELPAQHIATTAAIDALHKAEKTFDASAFSDVLNTKLQAAKDALLQLNEKRDGVKSFSLTVPQMASYYTPVIAKLLSIVEEMAIVSTNAEVTNTITAYTSLLQAKERAGQERAMGGAGFGAGLFAPNVYRRFVELIAEQKVLLNTFNIYASHEDIAAFENTVVGDAVDDVERMRKIAVNSVYTSSTDDIEGLYWFATITKKIDQLKEVEDVVAHGLLLQAEKIQNTAFITFMILLAVTIALLIVTAILVTTIVKGITRPVLDLTNVMGVLANGDTSVEINGLDRGDEIGDMSKAVNVFKDNMASNQRMAAAQEKENQVKEEKRIAVENRASGGSSPGSFKRAWHPI